MNTNMNTKWRSVRNGYTVTHHADYRGFHVEVESYGKVYGPHWRLTLATGGDWSISRDECRFEHNVGSAKAKALAKADELIARWEREGKTLCEVFTQEKTRE